MPVSRRWQNAEVTRGTIYKIIQHGMAVYLPILITNDGSSSSEQTAIVYNINLYHVSQSTSSLHVEFPFLPRHIPPKNAHLTWDIDDPVGDGYSASCV